MVWRKLLAGLGLGGVEADTVLAPTPGTPGGSLTGQVNLRVKSDTDIASITLILVANGPTGEIELSRHQVAGALSLQGGGSHSVPFSIPVPVHAPFTVLYGQALPGFTTGVRTELTVSSGSAKGDFDPVRIEASGTQQSIMDALGTIGAKFAGNAVRPGAVVGLPVPAAQAITFFAPVPEGQQLGPHIPQITFLIASTETGLTVVAELAGRTGAGERHELSRAEIERLETADDGWVTAVDGWLIAALKNVGLQGPGAFLQQPTGAPGYAQQAGPRQPYAYGGRGGPGYQYDGYRRGPSMAGSVMAGMAGGALGFLGTMMIMDMLTPDMPVDAGAMDSGAADAGASDSGAADAGGDYGGDYGSDFGGDFGGGDWGGGFGEF